MKRLCLIIVPALLALSVALCGCAGASSDSASDGASSQEKVVEHTAEKTYKKICNLTKKDCTSEKGFGGIKYSYNGVTFLMDDCEWIDSPLNKEGTVEPSAFYDKLAMCLEGFDMPNTWTMYAPSLIGYTPSTREEFAPIVAELSTYVVTDNAREAILAKFKTLSTAQVSGDLGEFAIVVPDVSECVQEMGISEEMFAYIMAKLKAYGADISFDGNSCKVASKDFKSSK